MKVRTKKGFVDTVDAVNELSKAAIRLGSAAKSTANAISRLNHSNYLLWKSGFKPQSQAVVTIIPIIITVLVLAEVVWFWLTKL